MPLTNEQVVKLQQTQSKFGCGRVDCVACYPITYACEFCGEAYEQPIANGEAYACVECGWDTEQTY